MKKSYFIRFFILVYAISLLSLPAYAVKDGGRVIVAMKGDAVILNPLLATDNSSGMVTDLVFDGLVEREKSKNTWDPRIVGKLAEKWDTGQIIEFVRNQDTLSVSVEKVISGLKTRKKQAAIGVYSSIEQIDKLDEDSFFIQCNCIDSKMVETVTADVGTEFTVKVKTFYIFHLRQGVRWHDGAPFTAKDVVFTYQAITAPESTSHLKSNFDLVDAVEAIGSFKVRVVYSAPYPKALESWTVGILPSHILKGQSLNSSLFNRYPIGTGPFTFEDWAVNDYILLKANPNYFNGRPHLDHVLFRIIPDESHMYLELLAGNVDIMRMKPDQFYKVEKNQIFRESFTREVVLEPEYTYVGWNLERDLFKDERVRRAMTYAINRGKIVKKILRNYGEVISGPFYKKDWAYDHSILPLEYDPKKASALLKEAGFEDINGDGILDKDMGNYHLVFSFDLLTNAGNKDRELTAMAIQEELSGIGIDIHVRFEEWTTFISKYIDRKNFDAILLAWGLSFDPDDTYSVWSLGEIPDVKNGKFGLNAISFANQEVEDHYLAARLMLDRAERKKHYYRIHEIINQQQPYTFLYSAQGLFAVSRRIHNVQVNEISAIYNLETWWVD